MYGHAKYGRYCEIFCEHVTLRVLLLASLLFRVALLLYGEWQDAHFDVKFTDIDYHVFSDASRHVSEGRSPFQRATYRYTPLLAILLVPNHLLFSFGKTLFILCDLLVAWLIYEILRLKGVKRQFSRLLPVTMWLLNPLTATVSARGNAESFLAVLVLSSLYFLFRGRLTLSAVAYGTAVHVKIFPIIYSLPILLLLGKKTKSSSVPLKYMPSSSLLLNATSFLRERFVNSQQLKFAAVSAAVFSAFTGIFYLLYGADFIREAYLYHVTRRDIKHNFSVYFYLLYLVHDSWLSLPVGLLVFLPQACLLLGTAVSLYEDITFCCFVQTFVFVTFNKVCTSQYFLWYLCLLPLLLPFSQLKLRGWALIGTLWFAGQVYGTQSYLFLDVFPADFPKALLPRFLFISLLISGGLWLSLAYLLEFRGYNVFLLVWIAGLLFFYINVYTLARIITSHTFTPSFITSSQTTPTPIAFSQDTPTHITSSHKND